MYGQVPGERNALPPGPSLPPRSQALRWVAQPYEFLRDCAREFGDIFTLDMGAEGGRYVIVSDPAAIRSVVTAEVGTLRACNSVLAPMLGPGSLLILDGPAHVRDRKLLVPAFQHKSIATYGRIVEDAVASATSEWSRGSVVVAQDVLQALALDVIFRIVFGPTVHVRYRDLRQALLDALNDPQFGLGLLGKLAESGTVKGLGRLLRKVDHARSLAVELVAAARESGWSAEIADGALLGSLATASTEQGVQLSDEDLRDEVLTLLATGHETTATAVVWGLYWVSQRDDVRERLRAELRESSADAATLASAPFLDATCKEILRIYPIVPALFRQVEAESFELCGHALPRGTFVSPSIYLTHHRDELYPHPDRFDPARFLNRTFSPYEYLPFGAGPRRCIGMHLAILEMKIVLAHLFGRFEWEVKSGGRAPPARQRVTVAPGEPLHLLVTSVRR